MVNLMVAIYNSLLWAHGYYASVRMRRRHTVVGLCVYLYVCNVFLGDRYKLGTVECNVGTTRQYHKSNSLGFLI